MPAGKLEIVELFRRERIYAFQKVTSFEEAG